MTVPPAFLLGLLLVGVEEPVTGAAQGSFVGADTRPLVPVAEELAVIRAMQADVPVSAAVAVIMSANRPAGERFALLRRLERADPREGTAAARQIVMSSDSSSESRFLAVNALAVLARSPEGRVALVECSERAPTPELRRVARTLLAKER